MTQQDTHIKRPIPTAAPKLPKDPKILFFDFDGTVLPTKGKISEADIEALGKLKGRMVRAVATGRGLYALKRDCPVDMRFDYAVFSSGIGLCRWDGHGPGPIIFKSEFTEDEKKMALEACLALKRGFMAFQSPPECHRHVFFDPEGYGKTVGYSKRLKSYADFASPYTPGQDLGSRSEFLIPAPTDEMPEVMAKFEELSPGLSLLTSHSPFGDDSIWLEILPPDVNKGAAAAILADCLDLAPENAVALGNDYNDLALLKWAGAGFVTANGAAGLHNLFQIAPDATDSPLSWLYEFLEKALPPMGAAGSPSSGASGPSKPSQP